MKKANNIRAASETEGPSQSDNQSNIFQYSWIHLLHELLHDVGASPVPLRHTCKQHREDWFSIIIISEIYACMFQRLDI